MKERGIIQSISIIIIILVIVFLSQQPYFRKVGENVYNQTVPQVGSYWSKADNWARANIYPKISDIYSKVSSGAQDRGESIKNDLNQEKQKVSENFGEKIKNYFSGIVDSVFHPSSENSQSQNCTQTFPNATK